jgi:hypothetical protein
MDVSSNTDPRRTKSFLAAGTYFLQLASSGRQVRAGIRQSMPSSEGLQEYPLW